MVQFGGEHRDISGGRGRSVHCPNKIAESLYLSYGGMEKFT